MYDCVHTWKKKLRLKTLVEIARVELQSGNEINQVYEKLDEEMQNRWNLVLTTRKKYLENINKILANKYVLGA